ncbi:Peptidyl-prolyl cis-trans isomerase CYP21-4 [Ananas comosus]|uniref:Peptidyl-prolyl cis-trans isomerase CYP21-4 n=1 Tax=Ananas comosus TaxID=4615 RepID=A0A199W8X4_ANACO|nr:Peptidyl-prolyl cis-trans isomerase CYP21-4 [Ananas comosus]
MKHSESSGESRKFNIPSYAVLVTTKGSITTELFKDASSDVMDKFVELCPKHEAFMLGTTKASRDSKGFDLFITTAPIPDLNDKLIVFGRVIKGEDIVQEIEEVDTDEHYQPKSVVGIVDITLKQDL